jgi:CheY-like chemotaxis protein
LQTSFQDELKLIQKYEELFSAASRGAIPGELLTEVGAVRELTDWSYLQEEIPKAMDQMLEGLGRVSTIVRSMKEFSHVDRSNEKSPADLNRALESTLIVARNEWKYVADVETDFGPLPLVVCHLGDLNQAFLNIVVNAAQAIEDQVKGTSKKGKICVQTRQDGDWVEINISDSGSGIPEELRERVFDPFFTTKEVGRGTGQGLPLARAIVVEKHGGTLTFPKHHRPGNDFYYPASACDCRRTRGGADTMKRILFVDDEVSILDGLRRILRPMRKKWETAFASSGESALAVLDEAAFDVVVSDMRMPGMDGAALLELIREKSPGTLRIILSGYTELQASLRAVPVAHQFLLKPCDADMLSASIARATRLNEVLNSRMLTNLVGSILSACVR